MDKIILLDDSSIWSNLNELRHCSFITLKVIEPLVRSSLGVHAFESRNDSVGIMEHIPRLAGSIELGLAVYYSVKIISIEELLKSKSITKSYAYGECRKIIPYEYFRYKIFSDFFVKLKRYAETGLDFDKIADIKERRAVNRIFWPKESEKQKKMLNKLLVFEQDFEKKKPFFSEQKHKSLSIRGFLVKTLSELKVLEKTRAIYLCRNNLDDRFDIVLFEENWRYLKGIFSTQKD